MSISADILSLLAAAHDLTRSELAPNLRGEDRYKAAMVANALAITLRAAQASEADAERAGLAELYPTETGQDIAALRRRLVADIRAGVLDADDTVVVEKVLRPRIAARLKVSYPEYDATLRSMENKGIRL
jgi:hypothetical protein